MRRLNFLVPSLGFGSYLIVARNARQWIDPLIPCVVHNVLLPGYFNVRIDCIDSTLREGRPANAYWCDTCADPDRVAYRFKRREYPIVVCSEYDKSLVEKVGVKVTDVIGRIPSTMVYHSFNDEFSREYDILFMGFDLVRKGWRDVITIIHRLRKQGINVKPALVCPHPQCNFTFGAMSERDKIRLFHKSKMLLWISRREGYGIPPLEAMCLGTLVAYSNAPAHNEFCYGRRIKIRVSREVRLTYGKTTFHFIDIDDAVNAVKEVLSMTKDEYQNVVARAREKAEYVVMRNVDKLNSRVYEWVGK